jgi:hypothetical protein
MHFNVFMNRKALDYLPDHACRFHLGFSFPYFIYRPYGAGRYVVQSGYYATAAGLPDIPKTNRVVRAIPAHRLFHSYHIVRRCAAQIMILFTFDSCAGDNALPTCQT